MELSEKQIAWCKQVDSYCNENENLCYDGKELGFSWNHCDVCKSKLGGDRYSANIYNVVTEEVTELAVCTDCINYIANSEVPSDEYL